MQRSIAYLLVMNLVSRWREHLHRNDVGPLTRLEARRRLIGAPKAARVGFRPIGQILGERLEAPTGR
jgi:hypothetical protein